MSEIKISEGQLKRAVEDYLTIKQNQGKLMFRRLNSGGAYLPNGKGGFYKIQLCEKGTADYEVQYWGHQIFEGRHYILPFTAFLELKSPTGKQSKEQKEFQKLVESFGCEYLIVRDVETLIEKWGN